MSRCSAFDGLATSFGFKLCLSQNETAQQQPVQSFYSLCRPAVPVARQASHAALCISLQWRLLGMVAHRQPERRPLQAFVGTTMSAAPCTPASLLEQCNGV